MGADLALGEERELRKLFIWFALPWESSEQQNDTHVFPWTRGLGFGSLVLFAQGVGGREEGSGLSQGLRLSPRCEPAGPRLAAVSLLTQLRCLFPRQRGEGPRPGRDSCFQMSELRGGRSGRPGGQRAVRPVGTSLLRKPRSPPGRRPRSAL